MSKSTATVTGTIIGRVRKGNTVYGNPIWVLSIDVNGDVDTYRVSDNAGCVYMLPNIQDGERVTLSLTKAGRFLKVDRVSA